MIQVTPSKVTPQEEVNTADGDIGLGAISAPLEVIQNNSPIGDEVVKSGAISDPLVITGENNQSSGEKLVLGVVSAPPVSQVNVSLDDTVIDARSLERRKSVKDLVTDFSSCLSNLSSSEGDTVEDWAESVSRRKKKDKKRKLSTSPVSAIDSSRG